MPAAVLQGYLDLSEAGGVKRISQHGYMLEGGARVAPGARPVSRLLVLVLAGAAGTVWVSPDSALVPTAGDNLEGYPIPAGTYLELRPYDLAELYFDAAATVRLYWIADTR